MVYAINSFQDCLSHGYDTVIDVRAPAEFAEDHMPGAISLPVLDDAERARVGTIYKQDNPFSARKIGAALVARNAARHIEGPLAHHDGGWRPLVYCWRGGQRSNSFASILAQIGWRVDVIDGGYRSFRRAVNALLYETPMPVQVVLLDGNTGTAKTELLHMVAARGGQILDLEGLANHRGSVFGAMGQQPAQKAFETALAERINALDPTRPVLIEAESSKVGARVVPPSLWAAMRAAPRITIEAPVDQRARYLVAAYGDVIADATRLNGVLAALRPHQGAARIEHWQALAGSGAYLDLAEELILHHYDPRYGRQRGAAGLRGTVTPGTLDREGLNRAADRIAALLMQEPVSAG
ncbi:tRNA 2-selenouridine(34) synthase MnmH [Oceaniglobus trochenteri]|uniref:tRNA 2-selenouridine(34) synthase MnmH n=1 Tax=Oceaniglobus trochenteri TaxID=2763260 RepID=UPI001CFF680D|nr:tRNA 2-selenouridine(34) synthase MnmH [Oceaniglobus trochenteri]